MIADWSMPFLAILFAEFGDKTMLAVLSLSSRVKNHSMLLLGAMCGFFLVDGIAIACGASLVHWIPREIISIAAGLLFIFFGVAAFRSSEESGEKGGRKFNHPFLMSFAMIAMSEWGDKTQIASALFAAQFNPWLVLLGAMSALFAISLFGVYLGKWLGKRVESQVIAKISGIIFVTIGLIYFIQGTLHHFQKA